MIVKIKRTLRALTIISIREIESFKMLTSLELINSFEICQYSSWLTTNGQE